MANLAKIALLLGEAVKNLLNVKQVAHELEVSARTVYRLIDEGALPAKQVRGSLRVDREELGRYVSGVSTSENRPD